MDNRDDMIQLWLKQSLAEPELADAGFDQRVVQKIEHHRNFRRKVLIGSMGGSAGVIGALLLALKPTAIPGGMGDPATALFALALLGIWGAFWISTEAMSSSLSNIR